MIKKVKTKYGDLYMSDQDHMWRHWIEQSAVWEEDMNNRLLKFIKKGSNVLDVGANIGTSSIVFLQKDCFVHAFEPQKFIVENMLNKAFKDNKNIKIYHNACGNYNGEVTLSYIDEQKEFYNPLVCKNLGGQQIGVGGEKVNIIKIDDLNIENISLIKIDVETYELQVILGCAKIIKRDKPAVVFEYHYMSRIELNGCMEIFNNLNYTFEDIDECGCKNLLCIPPE
jgi:FkbM family methyltransferase